MFHFGRKYSLHESGFFEGWTDVHSHILPGVDDGVSKRKEAFAILDYYNDLKIKGVCFTPHVMKFYKENTSSFLSGRYKDFISDYRLYKKNSYCNQNLDFRISLGAEYMIDEGVKDHIDSGNLLASSGNVILIETSVYSMPNSFNDIIYSLQNKGYDIMLAHPERYNYMSLNDYSDLYEKGIFLQLNLLSLIGVYGSEVMNKSRKLLAEGLYKVAGSDLHDFDFHKHYYEGRFFDSKILDSLMLLK